MAPASAPPTWKGGLDGFEPLDRAGAYWMSLWKSQQWPGATQRPLRDVALNEAPTSSIWRSAPSWFIWGEVDRNIPPAARRFMAERAEAIDAVEIAGTSHALAVSQPRRSHRHDRRRGEMHRELIDRCHRMYRAARRRSHP
jgi:pimeloyl-ACP methyl ester carboxylesterase